LRIAEVVELWEVEAPTMELWALTVVDPSTNVTRPHTSARRIFVAREVGR
jgi:hypothetical protein